MYESSLYDIIEISWVDKPQFMHEKGRGFKYLLQLGL